MNEEGTERILFVGGGPAAVTAIHNFRKLDDHVEIFMVEPKDYVEVTWATFRTPFDAKLADETLLPLEPWCDDNKVKHVRAIVTKLTETEATLDNGDMISFTIAVICAGATAPWSGLGRGPLKLSKKERMKQLQEEGDRLLNAGSVCVVGGGLVGAELAGDLADFAQEQNKTLAVTLVHSGPHLCNADCNKGCGDRIQEKLSKLGVKVVLNERASSTDNGTVNLTKSGEEIEAKEVVMTVGVQAVNKSFLDARYLDEKGWVQVDPTFRVNNSKTLMSVGDGCNFLMKAANQVFMNKQVVAHNIKQVLDENAGKSAKALKNGGPFEL